MGYAVEPSHSVAELLRNRRRELGLTLRQVEEQSKALGDEIPFTLVARVEKGLVDPGYRRMNLLLRVLGLPNQAAAELADLEQVGGGAVEEPGVAYDDGVKAMKAGDLRAGLGHLLALSKNVGADRLERQNALLGLSVAAASMSRYHLAQHIVHQILIEQPEPSLRFRVLLHAAACWNRLGSAEAALAFLDRAERYVEGDLKKRAWLAHNRGATLRTMGEFDEAARALDDAMEAYRKADDSYNECRALGVLVHLKTDRGDLPGALAAARDAQAKARGYGHDRLWIMRRIDEGAILLRLGETDNGIAALHDALGRATSVQDDVCQFHAHYHLWKSFRDRGDAPRADLELLAAKFHLRSLDESTPEAVEVRGTARVLVPDVTARPAEEVRTTPGRRTRRRRALRERISAPRARGARRRAVKGRPGKARGR